MPLFSAHSVQTFNGVAEFIVLGQAAFVAYSLLVSAPVLLAWKATGLWVKCPRVARITFVLAFIAFEVWLGRLPDFISMIAAGWVLAVGLFPRVSAGAGGDSTRDRSASGLGVALGAAAEKGMA
jgi:hypothetical protein